MSLRSNFKVDSRNSEISGSALLREIDASANGRTTAKPVYDRTKRIMDVAGAVFLLVSLFPLILLIAALVKLSSRGSVIFRQERVTQGGRLFRIYKFRTMVSDAESMTGPVWAVSRDPRITPLGRFLRYTRLDELPQLINVIQGDMSLIGPRPERPEILVELAQSIPAVYERLAVKAGISGLAQISTGYAASIEAYRKKVQLDLEYIRNRSLLLDLIIAIKTLIVILTGRGAR